MEKFFFTLRSSDITDNDFESVHNFEHQGVKIEIGHDAGNWWIESVYFKGTEYNIHDAENNITNTSGNEKLEDLLEEGVNIETALEEIGAKWFVKVNDEVYAYI